MQFVTERDRLVSESQRAIAALRVEHVNAAERGDVARCDEIPGEIAEHANRLAVHRAMPGLAECRHCQGSFEPLEYVELVISAIVVHRRPPQEDNDSQGTEAMIFPRGEERHQVYCNGCAEESGLLEYLTKR